MALALEKKDQVNTALSTTQHSVDLWLLYSSFFIIYLQEWMEKMSGVEKVSPIGIMLCEDFFSKSKSSTIL